MDVTSPPSPSPSPTPSQNSRFDEEAIDFNVMVIIAAMLCALVCALGLNSMLQCVVQCAQRLVHEPVQWVEASRRSVLGLKKKDVEALPTSTYANSGSSPSYSPPLACAICLMDFSPGEKTRVLPKCTHRFHVGCIDKWLLSQSTCPTCRQPL
ncbi:hypothetical protein BT93_F2314 [Corymbia citriodora subsp. variegata]|nr:hypothetical protein BT93_F2314 [Corymbia citriodora subsp. variegata]